MFISRIRADSSGDRSPWGDFWFTPLGGRSASGARVTSDSAMQLSAVYASVRVLTESFAVLPFKLFRPKVGGGRSLVTDHWAYRLFSRRPNRFHNPFTWRELGQGHLVLRGNFFNEIVDGPDGSVLELVPRHPDRVRVDLLDNDSWRYIYTQRDGTQRVIRRDKMFHIRGLSSDGILGISPIQQQAETIGGAIGAQEYGNRFFQNDAKPSGGWIEFPGKIADKATRDVLTESIKNAISGQNRHRMLTLDQGMKYHEVGMSNKDSQFLESRGYSRTEIAGIFRVPPHMIGDLSRATFSNIEQQSIDFWMGTMLPWCERWEAAVEDLIGEDEGLEVEFDFRNLMRGDATSRAAYAHAGVLDGWLTRNEAREQEGLDPIDGLDEPLVPANEMTLTESNEPDEPVTPPGVDTPAKEQPEEGADARLQQLLRSNASRMARRIASGSAPSSEVLADALALDEAAAARFLMLVKQGVFLDAEEDELRDSLLIEALKGTP